MKGGLLRSHGSSVKVQNGVDMKFLLILLLILSCPAYGQSKLDIEFFVMGMIDDGNRKLIRNEKSDWEMVDKFPSSEIAWMDVIDSLVDRENAFREASQRITTRRELSKNDSGTYLYYSKGLAVGINHHYRFKAERLRDKNYGKTFTGTVRPDCLERDDQRVSFLLGAWIRFGRISDEQYSVTIVRSNHKFELLVNALKELGCEIVSIDNNASYDFLSKASRVESQTVVFKPTVDLAKEMNRFISLVRRQGQ